MEAWSLNHWTAREVSTTGPPGKSRGPFSAINPLSKHWRSSGEVEAKGTKVNKPRVLLHGAHRPACDGPVRSSDGNSLQHGLSHPLSACPISTESSKGHSHLILPSLWHHNLTCNVWISVPTNSNKNQS